MQVVEGGGAGHTQALVGSHSDPSQGQGGGPPARGTGFPCGQMTRLRLRKDTPKVGRWGAEPGFQLQPCSPKDGKEGQKG